MEGAESTTRDKTTGKDGEKAVDQMVLMSSKPLHRFVQKEPRALGIVIVILGCAEVLMGFSLVSEDMPTSGKIYIPFWQGLLFLVCGNLSIYTEMHPSKKMVTVCLAMYVVSLLGIVVSVCYRMFCLYHFSYLRYQSKWVETDRDWVLNRVEQLFGVEGILFSSSLCVSVLLIFLCVVARLALKSTNGQVIVQHIRAPRNDTTSN